MIDSLFKIAELALTLWVDENKRKDIDKFRSLKERWYAEYNKPDHRRDDAVLDNVELELRIFLDSFAAKVGAANTQNSK